MHPSHVEFFPAADEEQWEFIKRVIDDCDYYVLIIGGRYGSLTPDGISYTEQEYDYAMSIGLPEPSLLYTSLQMISRLVSQTATQPCDRNWMPSEKGCLRADW